MPLVTKRITPAVLALVATAQVAFSSASCCELRAALADHSACCHATSEPAQPSCCHKPPSRLMDVAAVGIPYAPSGSDSCLICSAGPKVAVSERVELPPVFSGGLVAAVETAEPAVTAAEALEFDTDEPFHRTALASCAWLCVWLI